jgi:hypothetical protein
MKCRCHTALKNTFANLRTLKNKNNPVDEVNNINALFLTLHQILDHFFAKIVINAVDLIENKDNIIDYLQTCIGDLPPPRERVHPIFVPSHST